MDATPSRAELEAAYCWENDDRASHPETTDFRRRLRYHQAQWREAHGHPIGSQPIRPKPGGASRPVGSRIPLDYAQETGANFLTAGAFSAATARLATKEAHQTFDQQRLWADLLWSTGFTFNLFGDLAEDLALADRAVHAWWPDAPGTVSDVRFEHSPGRFDASYLGSLSTFSAAFDATVDDGTHSIVAIEAKYHDRIKREVPKPTRFARYLEVTERSGIFKPDAIDAVNGTELTVMWLDHLLLLSMLQHPSHAWSWGRLVVVHPAGNADYADGCARYRDLLVDDSTFASITLEDLLDAGALPQSTTALLRERYLVD